MPDNQPLVSVIMNCLNCVKYLREAIDSVYAQTYNNWEIIFWDNASTDNSAKIAKSYDEKLRYFKEEETISLGAARNKALKQAKGEFIAFLDCDDIWMSEKLEKQIPLFKDPLVGLVYSEVINFNDNGKEYRPHSGKVMGRGDCFVSLLHKYFLSMPTVIIRRSTLEQQNEWFDPQFELIEEYDLFIRIAYKWHLDMCPDVLAKYRVHLESSSWVKRDLFFNESLAALDKYAGLFPSFSTDYYDLLLKDIYISKAHYLWISKKGNQARKFLQPYMFKNQKAFYLYLVSFFSYKIIYKILNYFGLKIKPKEFFK